MKIYNLLIALTASSFAVATITPWLVVTQAAQQIQNDDESPLTISAAQQVAAKITVRISIGQGGGSGVLIGKKGNTYLVLTNAHVVRADGQVTILTPDGQKHVAQRVKDTQVGDFDAALLEFNTSRSYQLAKFNNFEGKDAALNEGREVFAAGFPYNSESMRLVVGEVTQLPQEAFKNGTQVGYVTRGDIIQGMSGGPILDSFGSLVGINSTLANPVLDPYRYGDGSRPSQDKITEYRRANWSVPIYNVLTRLNRSILYSYKQLPKLPQTVTPTGYMAELDRKARLVTVRIENSSENGSGVIVAQEGNNYYVLTAYHVVKNTQGLKITTHDQRSYKASASDIKQAVGTDLAVIKFTSTQPYSVATLGNYSPAERALVLPGGWPAPKKINSQQWQWQFNPGIIAGLDLGAFSTQDKSSFSNGYDLIYSSVTYGGMSGGPVFDAVGQVIGIHGRAEGDEATKTIIGRSLGISIKTFLGLAERLNISTRSLVVKTQAPAELKPEQKASVRLVESNIATPNNDSDVEQWIEYGNKLDRLKKYKEAVQAFDKAITLDPNSILAHYGMGLALARNRDILSALKSFDKAIALVSPSKKRQFYYLWKYRSVSLRDLNRFEEALTAVLEAARLEPQDITIQNEQAQLLNALKRYPEALTIYNQIIQQDPSFWAYSNRGNIKSKSGDKKGALIDYDTAIRINPQFAENYTGRGGLKSELGDKKGALTDYDTAISINPQDILAYNRRGILKSELGDKKGALTDYDTAIRIKPQDALAYYNRGVLKSELGDEKGALTDYDTAIRIKPQDTLAYNNRGNLKFELGDKKGALTDHNNAIRLNPQYAEAYNNRGNVKSELGDKKGALIDFDTAISINPQLAGVYTNRGLIKKDLGDKKGALIDFDTAIRINSQDANAYYNRGLMKINVGDKEGALIDFNTAIRINPQFARAYSDRGNVKSLSGDKEGALIDFNTAIRINPQFAEAYSNRGGVKFELGDKEGAITDFNTAIRINPQFAQAHFNRGVVRKGLGDKKGALSDYDNAIRINPQYAEAYSNRGVVKKDLGDKKGALSDYDNAIRINPKFAQAYANRGILKSGEDKKGAVLDLTIAAQIFKDTNNQSLYEMMINLIQQLTN